MNKKNQGNFLIWGAVVLVVLLACGRASLSYAIENTECMDCHGDESLSRLQSEGMKERLYVDFNKFKFSVHNLNSIGCVDCHADIVALNFDNEIPHPAALAPVNCSGCHTEEGDAYKDSVHKKAGGKGISIPCYACHDYHYITHLDSSSVYERENTFCLKCHNPGNYHDWLPQKDVHFSLVECAVCHAPDTSRHVSLRFFDFVQAKFLEGEEFLQALNTDYDGFMGLVDQNNDNVIDLDEFENMVLLLRQKDAIGTFHGEVVVELTPAVHHINKGKANRECEQCHNPNSAFFQQVQISLNKKDGSRAQYQVDRKVLESYYVNHFYALGGTRVRVLDKIGLVLIFGGISVVVVHLSARILTVPTRRRRSKDRRHK
ncbi:MAG: hypothetical protein A2521_01850 [Deltaproteobacteria bacterium RIFOXYD12_FULL_57_12]|nr:MAG: hypothetical protein A2521_01850 [Deltaproteobacteria bacterium RIFOXYD12_FULL_57_12]